MSDTPRTDAHMMGGSYSFDVEFACQLERELNASKQAPTDNDTWNSLLESRARLERELMESRAREAQLKDASADRAIEIAGDQALVNLLSETREAFYESLRREAQLRSALQIIHRDHLWGSQEHAQDICAKALTLPAPPVVPVEDVKPLVDAIDSLNNAARFTVLIGEGLTELDAAQGAVDSALSTFTSKHKL